MNSKTPIRILLGVPHVWLRETISQTLAANAEILVAQNRQDLMLQAQMKPDVVVAEPFAFGEPGLDLLRQLKSSAPSVPLIVLLPFDTRDYRDAAIRTGANGVVNIEDLTTELAPAVAEVLKRALLANGIANKIAQIAQDGAPLGESAYTRDGAELSLAQLSDQIVEQLAPTIPTMASQDSADQPDAAEKQTFLRGLTLTSKTVSTIAPTRTTRTACNLNCGSHFCGLNVTVRDNHVVKIEPADFPDERYRRICLKGISYTQMLAHPQRLLHPLKRAGARGSGKWQRLSWDQAIDEITTQMRTIATQYGDSSLMFFPYSGQLGTLNSMNGVYSRLASALGASAVSPAMYGVDSAVPSGIEDALGSGAGYTANDFTDLPNSKLILIWGGDPAQSRMNWWNSFLDAKRAGARLVTIDPRFSITASKSDAWLPIRPGTDLYLALALARLIIEQNWMNQDFVLRHTVAPLLVREDNGRFLRASDLQSDDESYLVWDAQQGRVVAPHQASAPALAGRYDIAGIACRTAFDRLREMLQPYTPAFVAEKTGIAPDHIFALARDFATTRPARIFTLYGIDRWHHGATFGRLMATLAALTGNLGIPGGGAGVDGFTDGVMFNHNFNSPDGKTHHPINPVMLSEQIISGRPYPIKAVWVAFGNWLNQWPNHAHLLNEVLPRLDLIVTADHFMTETARWSDYVLPAAMFFEREDMVKGPTPYIQYQPAIVPPPGECRSDFDIAALVAQKLGCGDYFTRAPREYLAEILAASDETTNTLSFDELCARGVLRRNVPAEPQVAHRDWKFNTPTGRVEFYVERLLPFNTALPNYEPPGEADPEGEQILRYPLVCITEHSRYRVHSTFSDAPWLRELDREPRAAMHPSVAAARQIQDGDWVRLFNERGFVVLRARLNQTVPPGTVYLTQGWQSKDFKAGHPQSLTYSGGNATNAFGVSTSLSDVLVEVVRAEVNAND
ncbi:MAG: molybdopterin-dependent oxidoreductase [Chloroflexi bacterium]|nr:molybdopterin-dependent oxidoreductase [Chloroflexota bacterium]